MRDGETDAPEDLVRHALARLRTDSASAPEVPAAVTARIGAALRAAPPPAHAVVDRPRMSRPRVIALVVGFGAAAAALAIAIATLLHGAPAQRFPSGPTADRITVSTTPVDTPRGPAGSQRAVTAP